jgi:hypothetical protein
MPVVATMKNLAMWKWFAFLWVALTAIFATLLLCGSGSTSNC